jgi:hypothetical protein
VRSALVAILVAACSFRGGSVGNDGGLPTDATREDARPIDAALSSPRAIQNAVTAVDSASLATVTFAGAVIAGDLLICYCRAGTSFTNLTVSDNVNGAWTLIDGTSASGMFYRANSAAASMGQLTITVSNLTDPATTVRVSADEFSGIANASPLDQFVTTSDAATSGWTSTAFTAAANELVYVGVVQGDTVSFTPGTVGGVAMALGGQSNNAGSIATEYALASHAGSQAATIALNPSATQATLGVQATFVR